MPLLDRWNAFRSDQETLPLTSVGASLRLFSPFGRSSVSDSLVPLTSLLPKILPFAEPAAEAGMGVMGGVVIGRPVGAELVAATLGTFPRVGVGFVAIYP